MSPTAGTGDDAEGGSSGGNGGGTDAEGGGGAAGDNDKDLNPGSKNGGKRKRSANGAGIRGQSKATGCEKCPDVVMPPESVSPSRDCDDRLSGDTSTSSDRKGKHAAELPEGEPWKELAANARAIEQNKLDGIAGHGRMGYVFTLRWVCDVSEEPEIHPACRV